MRLFLISVLLSFMLTNCPIEQGLNMDKPLVKMKATVKPEGIGSVNPPNGTYSSGKKIKVEAISNDDRYVFAGWSGDTTASEDPLTFNITRDMDLVANFKIPSDKMFTLSTSVSPTESGSVDPSGGQFSADTAISVTASANTGWQFSGWTGDTTSSSNPLNLVMDNDYSLVANFEKQTFTLTTNVTPAGAGSIDPSGGTYTYGTNVNVTAAANAGWAFSSWSGDTTSTANSLSLTMDQDYSLDANFNAIERAFSNQITVTDSVNTQNLVFGMDSSATAGYDNGLDEELPPPPPDGSFYAQFNISGYSLSKDYRAIQTQKTVWELEAAPKSGQNLILKWDFSNTNQFGSLTLTDDPSSPTFQIDMKSQTSYHITASGTTTLYIISKR